MENVSLIGLSRQIALQRELDVVANNLANLNTTGFKQDDVVFQEYLMPVARDDSFQRGADRRMSFVWDRATATNMGQGVLEPTGNPLDVAVGGSGFFVVQTPEGERYTRNGSFEVNPQGQLVTKQGFPVMGENGPIMFEPTDTGILVGRDGSVSASGAQRGRLRLVETASPRGMEKAGENLFTTRAGAQAVPVTTPNLNQGFVEKSNVNSIQAMTRMVEVTRAYTALASSIERHDQLRRDAIRSLGTLQS